MKFIHINTKAILLIVTIGITLTISSTAILIHAQMSSNKKTAPKPRTTAVTSSPIEQTSTTTKPPISTETAKSNPAATTNPPTKREATGIDCAALSLDLTKTMYSGATVSYELYVGTRNALLNGVSPEQATLAQGSAIQQAYSGYLNDLKSGAASANRALSSSGCSNTLSAPLPGSMY